MFGGCTNRLGRKPNILYKPSFLVGVGANRGQTVQQLANQRTTPTNWRRPPVDQTRVRRSWYQQTTQLAEGPTTQQTIQAVDRHENYCFLHGSDTHDPLCEPFPLWVESMLQNACATFARSDAMLYKSNYMYFYISLSLSLSLSLALCIYIYIYISISDLRKMGS